MRKWAKESEILELGGEQSEISSNLQVSLNSLLINSNLHKRNSYKSTQFLFYLKKTMWISEKPSQAYNNS